MRRRELLMAALAAAATHGSSTRSFAQGSPLVHMTWGGQWGNGVAANMDAPFESRFGVKVMQERGGNPSDRITKLKLNLNNQIYDLASMTDTLAPMATAQGVFELLDESSPNLSNLKNIPKRFRRKDWVAFCYSALGFAYNTDEIKIPPTGFADIWNKKYKGRIVVPDINHSIGPYIIPIGAMAAGKDPNDTEAGFEMLKRLVDLDPIWARDTDTLVNSLANGDALISLIYKAQAWTARDRGGKIDWVFPREGALPYMSGIGIAKNTKNKILAEKYVNLACDPEVQRWAMRLFNYPGTNPAAMDKLPPNLKERAVFAPGEEERIIPLDQEYMSAHRVEWTDRWTRIVSAG